MDRYKITDDESNHFCESGQYQTLNACREIEKPKTKRKPMIHTILPTQRRTPAPTTSRPSSPKSTQLQKVKLAKNAWTDSPKTFNILFLQ